MHGRAVRLQGGLRAPPRSPSAPATRGRTAGLALPRAYLHRQRPPAASDSHQFTQVVEPAPDVRPVVTDQIFVCGAQVEFSGKDMIGPGCRRRSLGRPDVNTAESGAHVCGSCFCVSGHLIPDPDDYRFE